MLRDNILTIGGSDYESDWTMSFHLDVIADKAGVKKMEEWQENGVWHSAVITQMTLAQARKIIGKILECAEPDEILAVGDAAFQEKSRARMMEMMGGGTTVLFVSHSLAQIREMCSRVLWLEHGRVKMEGNTNEVCDAYAKE